jgi:predicted transcriptional regulator
MASDTKELKNLLHESIENIDDEELLRLAKSLLERKYTPVENIELNEYQKKRIDKAKASIARGDFLTNEKADELVAKWLNE